MRITRRQFIKYCTVAAGALGLSASSLFKLKQVMAKTGGLRVIWLFGQACTGCTTSLLNTVCYQTIQELLLLGQAAQTLDLSMDETLMGAMGTEATQQAGLTSSDFVLAVEGAIPADHPGVPKNGYCTIGSYTGAASENVGDVVTMLANHTNCGAILTIGTCSSYGGVPASKPYPTGAMSTLDYLNNAPAMKAKTICLPGCPPNPNWIVGTVASILLNLQLGNGLVLPAVDNIRRPREFYGQRVCNNCYRYPQAGAKQFVNPRKGNEVGDPAKNGPESNPTTGYCLRRSGCKGMKTSSDCPIWKWNSPGFGQAGVNWCVGAGAPCQGCVQKGFPDMFQPFWNLS